jgi:hypothetical protein
MEEFKGSKRHKKEPLSPIPLSAAQPFCRGPFGRALLSRFLFPVFSRIPPSRNSQNRTSRTPAYVSIYASL